MGYLPYFFIPFTLSLIFTPLVRLIAVKNKLISYPRPDRWHKRPTALFGGISIYLATVLSVFYLGAFNKNALGLFLGGTFLFFVGLADDRFHFMPYVKLFTQIIAGCIVIFFGTTLGITSNILLVIPLTLLWITGITNSLNLLDNIDGLAAGIGAIASLMLFFSSIIISNNQLGIYALILCGATLGFLPYNFNPARIFMGDSGSMFLGFSLAVISVSGTTRHVSNLLITMLIPVLILSVPIFDTIFVMVIRKIQRKNIFQGGKDHTSHHLVTLGLSQRKTVLLLYILSIAFGLIAILSSKLNLFIVLAVSFLGVVILLFFGFFLFEVSSHNKPAQHNYRLKNADNNTTLNSIFMHKRRIIEVLLDFTLICIAYYSSYFLRFEDRILSNNLYLIKQSLVWIILIKMSVFFIFGLYRGVWKYISISDLLTIFKVVSFSSVASIIFFTFVFRFQDYSRAVFFIDWLILLFLIAGTRILFRVLGEFFSRAREKANNILIFGAGDTGEMVIREIKRNSTLNYNPIGFIDDDISKIGNRIQGITVLGSRKNIKKIVSTYNVKEVLITIPSLSIEDFTEIVKICKECGLSYRKIKGILDKDEVIEFGKN
ncbi:MAG: hypothetical protein PHY94_00460 [Candidatus Omnitrophica bacterium]|nr:hypothetical protein [Candidatus Omnitrophota bacterium]